MSSFLFRAVCLVFSAMLIVMSLSKRAALFDLEQELELLGEELEQEKIQAEILAVKTENRISLEELEMWALDHGMTLPQAGQTKHLSVEN